MARPRIPILSTDIIVETAMSVGGNTGQFTLRDIADRLGVKQASLYNHVTGKAELIALMRDRVHEEMAVKVDVNSNWKSAIKTVAVAHRALLIAHPWLIQQVAEAPAALGAAITTVENLATVLRKAGFPPIEIRSIIGAVDVIVIGASIDWYAPPELFPSEVLSGSTDLAAAILAKPLDDNRADAVFAYTVDLMIESLDQRLTSHLH